MSGQTAAVRHLVYSELLMMLPVANESHVKKMMANLRLRGERRRFLGLRVSPGVEDPAVEGLPLGKIERYMNWRFGENLAVVPGFYRRVVSSQQSVVSSFDLPTTDYRLPATEPPFRLNLPVGCALYGYSHTFGTRAALLPGVPDQPTPFYAGILCQPLKHLNTFFLISSAKHDGPKAARLSAKDQAYFTQFEEVAA